MPGPSMLARRVPLLPALYLRLPVNLRCSGHCKFAPLFLTTFAMLLPQPLSFQIFALLPGGGMAPRSNKALTSSSVHLCLSSLFSLPCALFCATAHSQLLWHQSFAHSFPFNGGGTPSSCHANCRRASTLWSHFLFSLFHFPADLSGATDRGHASKISEFLPEPNLSKFQSRLTVKNRVCYTDPVPRKLAS